MDDDTKKKVEARLKRIAGQVSGIQRMIDGDRYCVDVLFQIAAIQAALMEAGRMVLAGHFETCLKSAMRSRDPRERRRKIDELMDVLSRFCRPEGDADGSTSSADATSAAAVGREDR